MSDKTRLEYRLQGFTDLELLDNFEYSVDHAFIESYRFNKNFTKLNMTLLKDVEYAKHQDSIDMKSLEIFLALLLTLKNSDSVVKLLSPPKVILPDTTEVIQGGKKIILNRASSTLAITIKGNFSLLHKSEKIYSGIEEKDFNFDNHPLKYKKLQSILENSNTSVKYMMLYEMLLSLLTSDGNYPSQKQVTKFFRTRNYDFVSYLQTRKKDKDYEEDSFTYLRNQLGHAEDTEDVELYKTLGEEVTTQKIIQIVQVINDCLVERS